MPAVAARTRRIFARPLNQELPERDESVTGQLWRTFYTGALEDVKIVD